MNFSLSDKRIVDTVGVSWYLYYNEPRYGLESWGEKLGIKKVEVTDWHNLDESVYIERCETDVEINFLLWKKFRVELMDVCGTSKRAEKVIDYFNFKLKCQRLQEESKWKVDVDRLEKAIEEYSALVNQKTEILRSVMPDVPNMTSKMRPKVMFRKDGSLSSNGVKWLELTTKEGYSIDFEGPIVVTSGYEPANAESTPQKKDWLFSLGWKPSTFKESKTKDGVNQVPQINLPHGKGVCPSVLELADKEPAVLELDNLSVISHRLSQLKTLRKDSLNTGFAVAKANGVTNTFRMKHKELVNLPKPEKPFGVIRSCLMAREGKILCGSDLSSLEDRIKQHFIWEYDKDYVLSMRRDDYDPHLELAKFAGMVTQDDIALYQKTEDKKIKGIRSIYKNGNYALMVAQFKSCELRGSPYRIILSQAK